MWVRLLKAESDLWLTASREWGLGLPMPRHQIQTRAKRVQSRWQGTQLCWPFPVSSARP